MKYSDELLSLASHLVEIKDPQFKQASARRAVSTAYYGLFQRLSEDVVFNLTKRNTPEGLREVMQRALGHRDMKVVCDGFSRANKNYQKRDRSKPFETAALPKSTITLLAFPLQIELLDVAAAFNDLQESREQADYDARLNWSPAQARIKVELARAAFVSWDEVKGSGNGLIFMAALLLQRHWGR